MRLTFRASALPPRRLNRERVLFVMQTRQPAFSYDPLRKQYVRDEMSATAAPGSGLTFMQVRARAGACVQVHACRCIRASARVCVCACYIRAARGHVDAAPV